MRKSALAVVIGAAFVFGACQRTDDGGIVVHKPVFGTVTDTVHPPQLHVSTDTHTVVVPKVEVKKETTTVRTPSISTKP